MLNIVKALFKTEAVKVFEGNEPFWYTSGKIGPYYINTHFLYGGQKSAEDLLKVIDEEKINKESVSSLLLKLTKENYNKNDIYKDLINSMIKYIKNKMNLKEIQYISGGERRDWFFSLIVANILNKPHITIFKDLDTIIFNNGISEKIDNINSSKVLHIADLITVASSYDRAWIPAVENLGGTITDSLVVVDRLQGGGELLTQKGVKSHALVSIDKNLFKTAKKMGYIQENQFSILADYIDNPTTAMKEFISKNPSFLVDSLNSKDEKISKRAHLCIDNDFYNVARII